MASNILGVDFGAKRVGLALAVAEAAPQRLSTLPNDAQLLAALSAQLADHAIDTVVVGLPRNLDGDDTAQTAVARAFAARLRAAHPEIQVILQDEAGTSQVARERLIHQKVRDVAAVLDQEAAAIIVEDFLA
ncbi:MAG TPA: Holliday junction resolvase RuvX [Candidatus Saccharimonadales bacterium]|nr:Holliday junction resolvase RuvX [Candidatus Saccharimonadales bacterium]